MYLPNWGANLMRGTNLEGVLLVLRLGRLGIPAIDSTLAQIGALANWAFSVRKDSCRKICFFDLFWDTLWRWLETLGPRVSFDTYIPLWMFMR